MMARYWSIAPGAVRTAGQVALGVLACLVLGACTPRVPQTIPLGGTVADLALPQDLRVYAEQAGADMRLLTPAAQATHWERYRRLYFAPWTAQRARVSAADAFGPLRSGGYAENLLPRTDADLTALRDNSWQESYPNRLFPGVVVRDTALRAAPTARPRFANPTLPGEGYPFDMWQYAMLPHGMPVLITHRTRDGAWVFVENALVGGWLAEQDVARVDAAFMSQWQRAPQLAVLAESTLLREPGSGDVVARTQIGGLLPQATGLIFAGPASSGHASSGQLPSSMRSGGAGVSVLAAVRDERGQARAVPAMVTDSAVALAPQPLTPGALAHLGNQIMGQPYGWGSMYGNRDCSAMLRDVFTPFGVWLPRNSAAQARAWTFTPFGEISSADKESRIVAQARPFATLLWLPGHIGLYLGEYNGKAMMFHDMWGVRTTSNPFGSGTEGRYIIGRAVVSTTRPGVELPYVQDDQGLLHRMQGMSTLTSQE